MNTEKAFEYDILNRDVNYTLVLSNGNAFYTYILKDEGVEVVRARSTTKSASLQKIRNHIIGEESHLVRLIMTTTERNLLTSVHTGFNIFNITTGTMQVWNGSSWV